MIYHQPVLLGEAIKNLNVQAGKWYLDATLGDGGHVLAILGKGGKVAGIDQDPEAIERVKNRFNSLGIDQNRYCLIKGNFRNLRNLVKGNYKGVIFDLGVSYWQLESARRGFSFNREAPLDMRMDPDLSVKALDLVNILAKSELIRLFREYGEIRDYRFADAISKARDKNKIETTTQLASIVEDVVGRRGRKIHPATTVFQALRIAINDELEALKDGLGQTLEVLDENCPILCISFHSLEDRVVKDVFRRWEQLGVGQIVTKKPIRPTKDEISSNPRARSAKLRVFIKESAPKVIKW